MPIDADAVTQLSLHVDPEAIVKTSTVIPSAIVEDAPQCSLVGRDTDITIDRETAEPVNLSSTMIVRRKATPGWRSEVGILASP